MLQMKTACQQCADLTRLLQDAAKEELQLYNNYFVDILFRCMQPRQQVRHMTKRGPSSVAKIHARPGQHTGSSAGTTAERTEPTTTTVPRKP